MNTLAIDVGLHTGWAEITKHGKKFESGEWNFTACKDAESQTRSWGMVYNAFTEALTSRCISSDIKLLAFELPPGQWKSLASRLSIIGLIAMLYKTADSLNLNICPVSPTELKKFATGKGQCSKQVMVTALRTKHGIHCSSSHEADATWIIKYMEQIVL